MSAIMLQNGRKMAKTRHNATKKFDWAQEAFIIRKIMQKTTTIEFSTVIFLLKPLKNINIFIC